MTWGWRSFHKELRELHSLFQRKGRYRFKRNRKGVYGNCIHNINIEEFRFKGDESDLLKSYLTVPRNNRKALKLWLVLHLSGFRENYTLDKKKGWILDKRR